MYEPSINSTHHFSQNEKLALWVKLHPPTLQKQTPYQVPTILLQFNNVLVRRVT
jgi:hypothetical protein